MPRAAAIKTAAGRSRVRGRLGDMLVARRTPAAYLGCAQGPACGLQTAAGSGTEGAIPSAIASAGPGAGVSASAGPIPSAASADAGSVRAASSSDAPGKKLGPTRRPPPAPRADDLQGDPYGPR